MLTKLMNVINARFVDAGDAQLEVTPGMSEFTKSAEYLAEKRKAALEILGDKWLLHPSRAQKRLNVLPRILDRK